MDDTNHLERFGMLIITSKEDRGRCIWKDVYPEDEFYNENNIYTEVTSFSCILTLLALKNCFEFKKTTSTLAYNNFYHFIYGMALRFFVPRLCKVIYLYFEIGSCEACAFLENLCMAFEIEALTHVCIERYVALKYAKKGWSLKEVYYKRYFYLCIFFAVFYACAPFFPIFGRYGRDFQCSTCTLDLVLPEGISAFFHLLLFFARGIKPVLVMLWMIYHTNHLLSMLKDDKKLLHPYMPFTHLTMAVAIFNILCWTPIAIIRGQILFFQLFYNCIVVPPVYVVKTALLLYELAPFFTTSAALLSDYILVKLLNATYRKYITTQIGKLPNFDFMTQDSVPEIPRKDVLVEKPATTE